MEVKEVRHVKGDEKLEFGPSSSVVRVRDSCQLPIVTPDVKCKSIDAVCQGQGDVSIVN